MNGHGERIARAIETKEQGETSEADWLARDFTRGYVAGFRESAKIARETPDDDGLSPEAARWPDRYCVAMREQIVRDAREKAIDAGREEASVADVVSASDTFPIRETPDSLSTHPSWMARYASWLRESST